MTLLFFIFNFFSFFSFSFLYLSPSHSVYFSIPPSLSLYLSPSLCVCLSLCLLIFSPHGTGTWTLGFVIELYSYPFSHWTISPALFFLLFSFLSFHFILSRSQSIPKLSSLDLNLQSPPSAASVLWFLVWTTRPGMLWFFMKTTTTLDNRETWSAGCEECRLQVLNFVT